MSLFVSSFSIRMWPQSAGGMKDPLGLSPCSFKDLNSYNLTKGSCPQQKHIWEICALRHYLNACEWVNWGGWWGEKLRQAMDAAPQLGDYCQASPREERNQAVAGTPFTWEEQREPVSKPAGVGSASCGLAQGPRQRLGTEVLPQLSSNWPSTWRNKPWSLATSPHPPRAHLPSPFLSGYWAHHLQTQELVLQTFFHEQRVRSVTNPRVGGDTEGTPQRSEVTIAGRAKKQRRRLGSSSLPRSHTLRLHCWWHLAVGHITGIS